MIFDFSNIAIIVANILVADTKTGTISNDNGKFSITTIPVGNYSLQIKLLGYKPNTKTDIIVRSQRSTFVDVGLQESSVESQEVIVTAGYFNERADQPVSMTSFSFEEIRRAPGSGGDISRIILGLPSLAKVNDQSNSLIVRGGSPIENAFYVDGIEIQNINHFPTQGATGGPIGIMNVDLIEDVSFNAGGFSAMYGDKLSSIMEMRFREGNRKSYDMQLDFNFAGIGGVTEGPLGKNGSYLFSLRRSYLDALVKTIDIGTTVAPHYGDAQLKLVYDISPSHSISLLDIFSDDHNKPDKKTAVENKMIYYGNQDIYLNTVGISWRALWNSNIVSTTSIAYSTSNYSEDFFETNSGMHLVRNRSFEEMNRIATITHFRLNDHQSIEIGAEGKHYSNSYDNYYDQYTDALGDSVPSFTFRAVLKIAKSMSFRTK